MNKPIVAVLATLMCIGGMSIGMQSQTADANAADHTAPSYDMKAQALVDLERVQKKFVDLANAVSSRQADLATDGRFTFLCRSFPAYRRRALWDSRFDGGDSAPRL